MYTLTAIAMGGAALTAVSSWLTQILKQILELYVKPTDPRHDPLVHVLAVVASVLCVEVATLMTVNAVAFSPAWWQALLTGAGLGLGVKISAQGAYSLLTSGKVDALPALATEVLQAFTPATPPVAPVDPPPAVTPAPLIDPKAIGEQITAAVVAALTQNALTTPSAPPAVTPAPTSTLIVPPGMATVPVEAGSSS